MNGTPLLATTALTAGLAIGAVSPVTRLRHAGSAPSADTPPSDGKVSSWQYAVFTVGNEDDGNVSVVAINNRGLIGSDSLPLFVWNSGVKTYLDVPLGIWIGDVDDEGRIVGTAERSSIGSYAYVWLDGQTTELPSLGGDDTGATAINTMGHIVGGSEVLPGGNEAHPCLWEPDGFGGYVVTDLGDHYGFGSVVRDINELGLIVGGVRPSDVPFSQRAAAWQKDSGTGEYRMLELEIRHSNNVANAVNDRGIAAGHAEVGWHYPLVWDAITGALLGELPLSNGFDAAAATDINNSNQVVGWAQFWTSELDLRGCLWEPPGYKMQILMRLLPPRHDWMELGSADDINDLGQIVGYGVNRRFVGSGYWLIPVWADLMLAQPIPGLSGQNNTLIVTGASPGSTIDFYYGLTGGGAFVPGCESAAGASNVALQIQTEALKWAGSAVADGSGVATLLRFVPPSARAAGEILIQAADSTNCQVSQLITERFE